VDIDEDAGGGGFGSSNVLYKADVNDPSLSNSG
jgi:hypothetical protein